jgi:hypothetical protein
MRGPGLGTNGSKATLPPRIGGKVALLPFGVSTRPHATPDLSESAVRRP